MNRTPRSRTRPGATLALALFAALLARSPLSAATLASAPSAAPVTRAAAAPGATAVRPATLRDVSTLPVFSAARSGPGTLAADDALVLSNSFQNLDGSCNTRGWIGEDRTTQTYVRVADLVSNRPLIGGLTETAVNPAPYQALSQQRLIRPGPIAVGDSGQVFYQDVGGLFLGQVNVLYPGADVIRTFGPSGPAVFGSAVCAAFDPSTKGLIVADATNLWRYDAAGGAATKVVGNMSGSADDTSGTWAQIGGVTQVAVDGDGNLWFVESSTGRLRIVRKNDGRVVTIAGAGVLGLSLATPQGVAVRLDGSAVWVAAGDRIVRIDNPLAPSASATDEITGLTAQPSATPRLLELSGTRLFVLGVNQIDELVGGTLQPRVGTNSLYASAAEANSGLHQILHRVTELAADGADGLYISDDGGHLVLHLKADGTIEKTAGVPVGVSMGAKAVRVGADMTTDPEEVSNWVQSTGYGNNWSQRLVSPPIDFTGHASAQLSFDVTSEMLDFSFGAGFDAVIGPGDGEFIAAQIEDSPGVWNYLPTTTIFSVADGAYVDPGGYMTGIGSYKITAQIAATGVHRVRIVVQSNILSSSEDGQAPPAQAAAVLDNIAVTDGATPLVPFADFEDGTLNGWSASAYNGTHTPPGVVMFYSRDGAYPATQVDLRDNFDFSDPSCVFQFTSGGGTVADQALARLTSPWVPTYGAAGATPQLQLVFNGKVPFRNQAKTITVWARGKNVGDTRPSFVAPSFFLLFNNSYGTDASSPYFVDRVVNFPGDFQYSAPCDSIQFFFLVEDRYEQFVSQNFAVDRLATKFPYVDDLRVIARGVDSDHDGVPDVMDGCPAASALGEDANGDGCVDATATLHHVETWTDDRRPIRYHYSTANIAPWGGANLYAAFDAAFAAWTGVAGASVPATKLPPLEQGRASASDGVNLITIGDDSYPFSPEVLAVTPTLSATTRTAYDDAVVLPGAIVDADILFNPGASFALPGHAGAFDLRSVATHEVGHLLGLSHSGVSDATMFFVQLPGAEAASLSPDDESAVSAAYPDPAALAAFGAIRGRVLRDTVATGNPGVAGALVTAVRLDVSGAPLDTVASDYSREDGSYALYRLPPGDYGVHIQALDGSVLNGLTTNYISQRLFDIASPRPFEPEWYSAGESASDDPAEVQSLAVTAGGTLAGIDVVTTLDTQSASIVATNPANGATDLGIDAAIQIDFSEAVSSASLQSAFKLTVQGSASGLAGNGLLTNYGRRFVFSPENPLTFSTTYDVTLGTQLTDLNGVPLAAPYTFSFTTQAQPPLAITNIAPRQTVPGALVTVTGAGFVPEGPPVVTYAAFTFTGSPNDTTNPTFITPTSMVVQIPANAAAGLATMTIVQYPVGPEANGAARPGSGPALDAAQPGSNTLNFTILPRAQQPSPIPLGGPIALGWAPTDVAVSPDGNMVYVVGDGGFSTVRLGGTSGGALRTAVSRSTHKSNAIALSPDGARAFITQTADSQIVVVDADPGSGTFGSTIATMRVEGAPGDVVVMPSNFRAYATDATDALLHEFNVRPGSGTIYNQLQKLAFAPGPGRQIVAHPQGDRVVVSTPTGAWSLFLGGGAPDVGHTVDAVGGIGITPNGNEMVVAAGTIGLDASGTTIPTGGYAKDVLVTPQGQSALVANQTLNRLQVVSLDPNDGPLYRTVVGYVGTGASPVSLATGANGSLIAVVNRASRDLSVFEISAGATPPLVRAVPDVATPGELVGLVGDATSAFDPLSHVDLGTGLVPATNSAGAGVGFRVPNLSQRSTQVVVERPDTTRSLALPFSVVDPVENYSPRAFHTFQVRDTACPSSPLVGLLSHVRLSPDGRTLGVIRESGHCDVYLDLYNVARDGTTPYGALIGSCVVDAPASSIDVLDVVFTQDGKHVWVADSNFGVRVIDVDPLSPTFGFFVGAFGVIEHALVRALAADPLGRFIAVGSPIGNVSGIGVYMPNTGFITNLYSTPTHSMAVTGDGRTLIAASDSVHFISTSTWSIDLTTGPYSSVFAGGSIFTELAVSGDGRRAIGLFGTLGDGMVVWNTDPAAGTVGAQVFAGWPAGLPHVRFRQLIPAPDGKSILAAGHLSNDSLYVIDISVNPPTYRTASFGGIRPVSMVRSYDGRTLFGCTAGSGLEFSTDARTYAFTLTEGNAMALETGSGQAAGPGELLPLPVQVRVTGALGKPEMGAPVNFVLPADASGGTIEGAGLSVLRMTDANGEASVLWRMPAVGAPQMTVTALGIPGAVAVANATVTVDDSQVFPVLVSLSPATGESGLNAGTPVAARFNQKMDPSVTAGMTLTANGNQVPGTFRLEEQGRFVIFQPGAPLPYSAACTFSVAAGALDTDGQPLAAGGSTSFTVEAPPAVAITAINPPAAPPGASITLNGTGFSSIASSNTVLVNGTPATVTQASLAALTLAVPLAATSGPLTVTVGSSTSPGVNFIVLPKNPVLGGAVGELDASQGIRDMVITPDGQRAYVTNPALNSVSALDLVAASTITAVTVGLRPQGVAILPDPQRLYVANTGSNSVSVVDIDPASTDYHRVIDNIPVGEAPVDVYFSAAGPKMYVLNAGASTLSVIDVNAGNATFNQVVKSVNTGSGATGVVVSADGTIAYVAVAAGLQVIDIESNQVVKSVNTGSGATGVVVTADGTLALVLTSGGQLVVIDLAPGTNQFKIVASVNTGSGATGVVVSADGTLAYVTDGAGNTITAFRITAGSSGGTSTVLPTAPVTLTALATFPTGQAPAGAAVDPLGRIRLYVPNAGDGTISVIGTPDALPLVDVEFDFNPNTLNLKSMGKWVTCYIEPPAPFTASQIQVASLRLNGSLAPDPAGPCSIGDHDGDGIPDLAVKFGRSDVQLLLPAGDRVPVCVSGRIDNRNLAGCDTITVKRGKVTAPVAHAVLHPGARYTVRWESPKNTGVEWVAILHSLKSDPVWTMDAVHEANDGSYDWQVPMVAADSVRLAIVFVESEASAESLEVEGVVATSDPFEIFGTTDVEAAPLALSFAPVLPNPAPGVAHLRFGLPARSDVSLEIFDVAGRRVKTVVRGTREAGWHSFTWKGESEGGGRLGAGLYFARFRANGAEFRHTFVLLR